MSPSPWDHPWEHFTTVMAPPQHPALCPFPALPPQHFFTNLLNILLFPLSPSRMGTLWGQGFCLFLVFMRLWLAIYHLSIYIYPSISIYLSSVYLSSIIYLSLIYHHLSTVYHWSILYHLYQSSIIDLFIIYHLSIHPSLWIICLAVYIYHLYLYQSIDQSIYHLPIIHLSSIKTSFTVISPTPRTSWHTVGTQ